MTVFLFDEVGVARVDPCGGSAVAAAGFVAVASLREARIVPPTYFGDGEVFPMRPIGNPRTDGRTVRR